MSIRQEQKEKTSQEHTGAFFIYALLGLLAVALLVSIWNMRLIQGLQTQFAMLPQQLNTSSEVFLSTEGWRPGRLAPDLLLGTVDARSQSFRVVAENFDVFYVAWDRCPVCLEHFPNLGRVADEVRAADKTFAVLMLLDIHEHDANSTLGSHQTASSNVAEMIDEYGWNFPVFVLDRRALLELNLQATPTVLIMRRGVLGEAFVSSSLETMIRRIKHEIEEAQRKGLHLTHKAFRKA
jgi:hypothetical protein